MNFSALQKEVDRLHAEKEAAFVRHEGAEQGEREAWEQAASADRAWTMAMNVLVRKRKAHGQTWNRGAQRWE